MRLRVLVVVAVKGPGKGKGKVGYECALSWNEAERTWTYGTFHVTAGILENALAGGPAEDPSYFDQVTWAARQAAHALSTANRGRLDWITYYPEYPDMSHGIRVGPPE